MAKNKTRIDVITVFDGELDAKTQDLCYTKDKVQVTGAPSGLCG